MAHEYKLDKHKITKIGNLLPRLKHAVEPIKIISWLENFEEDEVDLAIDLLSVYEYIPFDEFMFRLNDLLKEILKGIPKGEKIIIFPYGKVGKSGTLVTYPLKNTTSFKGREKDILLTHDFINVENPKGFDHIIFLDDFIGSGKTFYKEFSKPESIQKWLKDNSIGNIYILSTIIMIEGRDFILKKFPQVRIFSEERNKIFDKKLSPLHIIGNAKKIEDITLKHGNNLSVFGYPPYVAPYGFDNSQSLVSFFHCTPNNTLSVVWGKSKNWKPLFPRRANIRMDEAREFKKGIAFYIGICNKLGIDLYTGKSIIKIKQNKSVRKINHNTKQDHSVVALLFLKNKGYDNLIICHLLGITREELKLIYIEAKRLSFVDKRYDLTTEGVKFLQVLKQKTKPENFRKETKYSLRVKNEFYIPGTFNGLT